MFKISFEPKMRTQKTVKLVTSTSNVAIQHCVFRNGDKG